MSDKKYTDLTNIDWDNVCMDPLIATQGCPPIVESEEAKARRKRKEKVMLWLTVIKSFLPQALMLAVVILIVPIIKVARGMMDGSIEPLPLGTISGIIVMLVVVMLMLAILIRIRRI